MLTGTSHGKLINFGGATIDHEFVNCQQSKDDRCRFAVDDSNLFRDDVIVSFEGVVVDLLGDWGAGLGTSLYEEAVRHLLVGNSDRQSEPITFCGSPVGDLSVNLIEPGAGFYVTALIDAGQHHFERHGRKLLEQSSLNKLLWANVRAGHLKFATLF